MPCTLRTMISYFSDCPSATVLGPIFSMQTHGVSAMGGGWGINGCTGVGGTAIDTTGGGAGAGCGRAVGVQSIAHGGQTIILFHRDGKSGKIGSRTGPMSGGQQFSAGMGGDA